MTDVIKRINNSNGINNGSVIIRTGNKHYQTIDPVIDRTTDVSGYLGVTTNGYLDTRFDDYSYYQ